jgi:hypothetical protein
MTPGPALPHAVPPNLPFREIHQEEVDAMQDPIASAVVIKWVLEGWITLIPRGQVTPHV